MQVQSNGKLRRTSSEWSAIFEAYEASGLSESAFCRRKKIPKSTFAKWKQRLAVARRKPAVRKKEPQPGFIELASPAEVSQHARGEFELFLPGDVVLRWKA